MKEITEALRKFNEERDWEPFHTPENLAKSIAIEAGELLECFQWDSRYDREALSDEIADVMLCCGKSRKTQRSIRWKAAGEKAKSTINCKGGLRSAGLHFFKVNPFFGRFHIFQRRTGHTGDLCFRIRLFGAFQREGAERFIQLFFHFFNSFPYKSL